MILDMHILLYWKTYIINYIYKHKSLYIKVYLQKSKNVCTQLQLYLTTLLHKHLSINALECLDT